MRSIVVANWKMNPTTMQEAKKLLQITQKAAERNSRVSIVVAPPSIFLRELRNAYKGKKISFAAQNAHYEKTGSFTGEVSLAQVQASKIAYAIIGHAERRAAGETDEDVRKKVQAALDLKIVPILCVGESARGHGGEHYTFVRSQIVAALRSIPAAKVSALLIAYEPVWAIGAPKPMSAREMHEMAIFIRKTIVEMHGEIGRNTKILYGGAIDETNAREMVDQGSVLGLLVGRSSLDPARFTLLIESLGV